MRKEMIVGIGALLGVGVGFLIHDVAAGMIIGMVAIMVPLALMQILKSVPKKL
jgi:hypothetical protein